MQRKGGHLEQIAEFVHAREALGEGNGHHGTHGQPLAGEGFVPEGELIAGRFIRNRMDARHLPFADSGDFRRYAQAFLHQFAQRLGRSGRRIQFVNMMDFLNRRRISGPFQQGRCLLPEISLRAERDTCLYIRVCAP